jgi:large subunit ribosomal protein L20
MRIKRGTAAHHKHVKIRHSTKGMTHPNRVSVKRGKQASTKALQFAYRDRRNRKRTFRQLWNARINAAAHLNDTSYSKLIAALSKANIKLDRKILSELATNEPIAFKQIVQVASQS